MLFVLILAKSALAQAPSPPPEQIAACSRFIGGQWIVDGHWSDGKPLHARNVFEWGVNQATIHNRTFVSGDAGEYQRYEGTFAWDADLKTLMVITFACSGACTRSRIDTPDADTLRIGFTPLNPGDAEPQVRQVIHFTGPDAYTWNVKLKKDDGSWDQIIEATWNRRPLPAEAIDPTLFPASGPDLRSLTKEATVNAPAHDIFTAWTTPGGVKSFLDVDSRIALRIGGPMELLFGRDKFPVGQQGSEGCQILSYVPDRMLAFTWNAPPQFPDERAQRSWVVIDLEPAGSQTRVRLTHAGFGQGGHWDDVYAYFDKAWGNVLAALAEHYKQP
jgi:uncharacterized protein YndB with AHSA1/START domain